MRQFSIDGILKKILENRPVYGQDSICVEQYDNSKTDAEIKRRYLKQCALDNRFPSLVLAWLSLSVVCIMSLLFIVQPLLSHRTPFHSQYIYLYVLMIVFDLLYIILLHYIKKNALSLLRLELTLLAFMELWSAVFSAVDIINGYSSYLFIQITIIQALMYRGGAKPRCLFNAAGFVLYISVLLGGNLDHIVLFAQIINPFFMSVTGCAIILINDRIHFRSYKSRELICRQHEMLKYYADNDFLTNIPNRKSIMEYLESALSGENTVACMMIDIDNFKLYNDICGHIKGDDCIIRLAEIMNSVVKSKGGRIGRYGGEEFLAVFEGLDEQGCISTAEDIARAVSDQHIEFGEDGTGFVTISIGVSVGKAGAVSSRELIEKADTAMYKAKKEGKNRACLY